MMRYMKLTAVLRTGRLLPLCMILVLLQFGQSTSNLLSIAEKHHDLKNFGNLTSKEPGQTAEPHPTIVYKEDYVREDYDAFKSQEKQHVERKIKQNKIYFDVLPQDLIPMDDKDLKLNANELHVDIIPLTEDHSIDMEEKKIHRMRRDSEDSHAVKKRNPYIQYYADQYSASNQYQFQNERPAHYPPRRQPVQGVLWNGIDRPVPTPAPLPSSINNRFGAEDEEDRVVWDRFRPVKASPPRVSMTTSIFHDSNPANADFGFFTRRPQTTPTAQNVRTTLRPRTVTPPSIFHDSNPSNADLSFLTRRPNLSQTVPSTTSAPRQTATDSPITACVWAIVNCCSNRDQNVRYSCFEDHGCSGAFFDLNPCGDFKDRVIEYVAGVIN